MAVSAPDSLSVFLANRRWPSKVPGGKRQRRDGFLYGTTAVCEHREEFVVVAGFLQGV